MAVQEKKERTAYHSVDNVLELNHDHPLYGDRNFLTEIATSDGVTHPRNILNLGLEELEFSHSTHPALKRCCSKWAHRDHKGTRSERGLLEEKEEAAGSEIDLPQVGQWAFAVGGAELYPPPLAVWALA